MCSSDLIMGVPPFAGFYSKDKIIESAFSVNFWAGLVALLGAGLTAFYMTRLFAHNDGWEGDGMRYRIPVTTAR